MTHLTLLVLVDACRRDYAERAAFLRDLAGRSRAGALREDFGFVPRAAYFGGLTPGRYGFTNMFCRDPEASPFGVARGLPASAVGRAVEDELGIRALVEAEARRRVTPFAASYLSSLEIPMELLPQFSPVETRAPWDPAVGYRSIFHELDERRLPYVTHGWPETNHLDDRSDRGIVQRALAGIAPPCRFAFIHLQALDAVGHAHGPESAELAATLAETDALVEELVAELGRRFDRLDVVLFGDHGMVSVTRAVDVAARLAAAGLVAGRDLVYFLDSTMARFWFPGADLRGPVARALAGLPGRVLDADDLRRFDLGGCDPRNGELLFLADPGVLVMPNFFQRTGALLRGMHGYDPDCPDNQGLFLVHEHGDEEAADAGLVGPTAVYTETRRLLGLARRRGRRRTSPAKSGRISGLFTQHPHPDADVMVATHMSRVVEALKPIVPSMQAVLVTGSFGRGEGAVRRGDTGQLVPVNDYDVLVVAPDAPDSQSAPLRELGDALAAEFGADFVHVTTWPAFDPALPLTLAHYDIRYGSRMLLGDPEALATLPAYAAADLPLFEGVQLLFNRMGGLLTGLGRRSAERGPRAARYLENQTMKALMALGDWHLIRARAYDVSYRKRHERFSWLAAGLGVAADQRDAIGAAYQFKIHPESVAAADLDALARETVRWMVEAAIDGVAAITGRPVKTASEAAAAYYEATTSDPRAVDADNAFSIRTLAGDDVVQVAAPPTGSVRQTIYASIPLVASAWTGDREGFAVATERLASCLTPPWPTDLTPGNWEVVRGRLAHAWLTLVH
jgi:hypothetical protein